LALDILNHKSRPDGKVTNKVVLPGDQLATEEEFEPGSGAALSGENVVATRIGEVTPDMTNRVMIVKPARNDIARLPKIGDFITGTVQSSASSIAQIRIDAINDVPSSKDLSGMLSMRDDRRRRSSSSPVRTGDAIRAKVVSTTNAIYHLSLDGPNSGVIYTVCSFCGNRVIGLGRGAVKCTECGMVDDRLLSEDFLAYSRGQR
jgi:exosome complex component CSL4